MDVDDHKDNLDTLEAAVNSVLPLVKESDQEELNSQLSEVAGQYNVLKFNCSCYPVERWLEDQEAVLCRMNPTGVMTASLQVHTCICVSLLLVLYNIVKMQINNIILHTFDDSDHNIITWLLCCRIS